MRWSGVALLLGLAASGCAAHAGDLENDAIPRGELRPLSVAYKPRSAAEGSPRELGALFAALSDAAHHSPVWIVQVGDSHSAGDYFSARLRELFQARFGAAGRGVVPPGIPDRYYKPKLVSVTESDGWQRITSRDETAVADFGIAGVIQQTAVSGETMTLTSDEPAGFDRIVLDYRLRPDGGSLRVSVDSGTPAFISTRGNPARVVRADFATAAHSRTVTLQSDGNGPVEVAGWGAWRHGRGVLYQNFGIVGAQADVLARYDRHALSVELGDASLVVVIYGTNEAFGPASDLADYHSRFISSVRKLQTAAPHASILIVGPPDVNRSPETATAGGLPCPRELNPRTPSPALALGYSTSVARIPASGDRGATPAEWVRPTQLDAVLQIQRSAAAQNGWLFWDWSAAMGGGCSMQTWVDAGLGRADHVHMTIDGYNRSAELLFTDLMDRYRAWLAQHGRRLRRSDTDTNRTDTETAVVPR